MPDARPAGAPLDVPLAPGTYSAPLVSGEAVAVLELGSSTLLTFSADGAKVAELHLPRGTGADDLHRGEDGRLYVDERGGARTHVVAADGTITTTDLGRGAGGAGVAGAAPEDVRAAVAPPAAGGVTIPRPETDVRAPGPVDVTVAAAGGAPVPLPPTAAGPVAGAGGVVGGPVGGPGGAVVGGPGGVVAGPGGGVIDGPVGGTLTPSAPTPVPTAPVGVRAELTGAGRATITWQRGAGGGDPTGFTVTRSGGGTVTASTGTAVFPGLVAGTAYTFTVTASNTAGVSPASTPSNAVTPAAVATAPGAPKNPTFTFRPDAPGSNTGSTDLSWGAADLNGGTLLFYEVDLHSNGAPVTRTTTGTSFRFTNPGDFDACGPVGWELRTVTSVDGTETRSPDDTFASSPIRDCTGRKSVMRADAQAATVAVGDTVEVRITAEIGSEPAQAVRAILSFPAGQLDCGAISTANSAFDTFTEKSCGGGQVRVTASRSPPLGGGAVADVARITFTGIAPGSAALVLQSGTSVTGAETGTDTLGSKSGDSIVVTD